MVLWLNVCDKEHLALRNNFRVTKKFLITKFDCIIVLIIALLSRIGFFLLEFPCAPNSPAISDDKEMKVRIFAGLQIKQNGY